MARHVARSAGASLAEALVATSLLLVVSLALWRGLSHGMHAHDLGANLASLHQSVRHGLDEMAGEVRRAGFDHARDPGSGGQRESGEPIECMNRRSILFRANFDSSEGHLEGREPDLESAGASGESPPGTSSEAACCPAVTVGNDEIIGWALGKDSDDPDGPQGSLRARLDLDAPRDGRIKLDGSIAGERTLTINGIVGDGEALDFPPYVLTKLSISPSGVVVRQPVADGITSLELRYFDGAGQELDPVGGGEASARDDAPERLRRAAIRKVSITIRGMTGDPDLALASAQDDAPAVLRGHRELELRQDVLTLDVGAPLPATAPAPEPVTDVRSCSGQCGTVKVAWRRSPSSGAIEGHVVTLARCPTGPASADFARPVASVLVSPRRDAQGPPDEEHAILTGLERRGLDGEQLCARVVVRAIDGRESKPADASEGVVLQDVVRPEAASQGRASGFDRADPEWPLVEPDAKGGAPIVTAPEHESFPLGNRIEVSFVPPRFGLDRRSSLPGAPWNWTTRQDDPGLMPSLSCHSLPSDGANGPGGARTPLEELPSPDEGPNTYVFRVSGSDPESWGPSQHDPQARVDHPCRFVPFAGNLLAFVALPLAADRATFIDDAASEFASAPGGGSQYDQRFIRVGEHAVRPAGAAPPLRAVQPGEIFYYRIRTVDRCWRDDDRDGVHDDSGGDSPELAAWSTAVGFNDEAQWRKAATCLSPFYPPLLPDAAPGKGDRPSPDVDDSDEIGFDSGCALPGLAIPPLVDGDRRAIPERPTELALARRGEDGSDLLPSLPGTAEDATRRGVRLVFNAARRTAPEDMAPPSGDPPVAGGYAWYRLCRRLVELDEDADPPRRPTASELEMSPADADVEAVTEVRLRDPDGWRALTIDRSAEVQAGMDAAPANAALFVPWAEVPSGHSWAYRLFTVQVAPEDPPGGVGDESSPKRVTDDGITPSWARWSRGSPPFLMPCGLQEHVRRIDVQASPSPSGNPGLDASVDIGGPATCDDIAAARVLAFSWPSNDFVGSSRWIAAGLDPCVVSASPATVATALRGHAGSARIAVEISSSPDDVGHGPLESSGGCRVRSDLPGDGAVPGAAATGSAILPGEPAENGP